MDTGLIIYCDNKAMEDGTITIEDQQEKIVLEYNDELYKLLTADEPVFDEYKGWIIDGKELLEIIRPYQK